MISANMSSAPTTPLEPNPSARQGRADYEAPRLEQPSDWCATTGISLPIGQVNPDLEPETL